MKNCESFFLELSNRETSLLISSKILSPSKFLNWSESLFFLNLPQQAGCLDNVFSSDYSSSTSRENDLLRSFPNLFPPNIFSLPSATGTFST